MDLSRNARNDDEMQAASNDNQIEGAAMDNAIQDPPMDDNMPAELLAACPPEYVYSICESFLDMMLRCNEVSCCVDYRIDPCGILRLFREHYKFCENCLAIKFIDHARMCTDVTCEITFCNNIKEKLETLSEDRCLHMAISNLQGSRHLKSDRNILKLLIQQLMKLDGQTDNDATTSSLDSDDQNFPPSGRRRITGTEAAEYWLHLIECDDDNCEFKTDSTSCEEKIEAVELRIYCTINCTECQLFEQFVNRHAQKCQLGSCPIHGCNEIRHIDDGLYNVRYIKRRLLEKFRLRRNRRRRFPISDG